MAATIGKMMTIDAMKNNDSDDDDDTMLMICQSSQPAWPLCGESAPLDASPPHRFWNQNTNSKTETKTNADAQGMLLDRWWFMILAKERQGYKMLKQLASIPTQQYGNLITESLELKV